jgi:spore maturation protein CgeB
MFQKWAFEELNFHYHLMKNNRNENIFQPMPTGLTYSCELNFKNNKKK